MLGKVDEIISRRFLHGGAQVLAVVAAFGVLGLGLVNLVTVAFRRSPLAGGWLTGGYDFSQMFMVVVSACSIGYCWYRGGHIRISMLHDRATSKGKGILDAFSALAALVWIGLVVLSVWELALTSFKDGSIYPVVGIPMGPFKLLFALGMAHFFFILLRSLFGFLAKAGGRTPVTKASIKTE